MLAHPESARTSLLAPRRIRRARPRLVRDSGSDPQSPAIPDSATGRATPLELPFGDGLRGLRGGIGPCECWLLPALGLSSNIYAPLLERLADRRPTWALDLPGFGVTRSRVRDPAFSHHLVVLRKALERQPQPVILVGHSVSGTLALELARQSPGQVRAVVLCGFGKLPSPGHWRRQLRLSAAHPERLLYAGGAAEKTRVEALRADYSRARVRPAYESFLDEPGCRTLEAGLRGVRVPIAIWHGAHDRVIPGDAVEASLLDAPGAKLEWVAQSGHMALLEHPDAFARFLDERATG